ncbi:MAG: hypothetical protein Q7S04_00465 [Candidatus Moranbacteria bacterium]|nr:hypothetical protein [Candidatus Moranbacteria bacterium]
MAEDEWRKMTIAAEAAIREKNIARALEIRSELSQVADRSPKINQYYRTFYDLVLAIHFGQPVQIERLSALA